jgi:phosphoribosylformylglycinamidine synthase
MTTDTPSATAQVRRIEVRPRDGEPDAHADHALTPARVEFGHGVAIHATRLFLIQAPIDDAQLHRINDELLTDAVCQTSHIGTSEPSGSGGVVIEVHYKPGVMDPVAQSTRDAIAEMLPHLTVEQVQVRTGFRYDISGDDVTSERVESFARRMLANPVIQDIYTKPHHPDSFLAGTPYELKLTHVPMRNLDDAGLTKLSREGHLFLSLDEMRAVQQYFGDREPTDVELETLAQTWSEHCVHKTLKSNVHYSGEPLPDSTDRPGFTTNADGSVTINNLLKSTIAAATHELMRDDELGQWCISVFEDNAGVVQFDEHNAVCIKVETHNHPSAIEPYGGAATGIGGCIRDVIGTGLAAMPIANTDVFCVASPEADELPAGVIHPKRILEQIVGGVRDYGNRMGIPTLSGAVWFHDDYLGNPLVYCGCIGIMPIDKCFGDAQPGDRIIVLGGRTGRDGIHGATFSSAELTDTHADEFSHAVQIGNAITEKKTLDVIIQARDHSDGCLFSAITDCGAGGYSSAVGEMGEKVGAQVTLETAPLKYAGLSYTEIWISEAQERMVLAVPEHNVEKVRALCDAENVEMCDLGRFGHTDDSGDALLTLTYKGEHVGTLSMDFMHNGIPQPTRKAVYKKPQSARTAPSAIRNPQSAIHALLAHPNIASKHWIIRQYDHEVQGGSAVKPLVGPHTDGPSDAAVIRPVFDSDRGVAISCGLQTGMGEKSGGDSYWMVLAAIDEAVRNLVCVGADPTRIAILDNFCWPSCDDPQQLGSLVRASVACYDAAMAYRTPFVSGKDSLNNQFTTEDGKAITIPPTLLITSMGIVSDVTRCVTMDAKAAGNLLLQVGATTNALAGSHAQMLGIATNDALPQVDLKRGPATARVIAQLIADGRIASAHDCSDGGMLVAAAEMAFAGRIGLDIDLDGIPSDEQLDIAAACFAETPSRYLLEIVPAQLGAIAAALRDAKIPFGHIGTFGPHQNLTVHAPRDGRVMDEPLDALRDVWLKPLDW